MSVWGADVAGLQAVAADLAAYAESIEHARRSVDAQLQRTAWEGPNAAAFRARWRTMALRDLDGFQQELAVAAADLRRQAEQQLEASASSGMRLGGGSGSGFDAVFAGGPRGLAMQAVARAGLGGLGVSGLARLGMATGYIPPGLALTAHAIGAFGRPDGLALAEGASGITELGLNYMEHGLAGIGMVTYLPGGALGTSNFWSMTASGSLVTAAGATLTGGVAAITSGFSQWNSDIGEGFSTGEQATRATTVGAVNAGIAVGIGAGVGAALAATGVGAVAAPAVGMAVSTGVHLALEHTGVTQSVNDLAADAGSQIYDKGVQAREGFEMMGEAASDVWDEASSRVVSGASDMVTSAGDVLDSIGGGVDDVVSATAGRLNPFSW